MAKVMSYRHCTLIKSCEPESRRVMVSFIPEMLAQVGRALKLKQEDNTWEDGWIVENVGARVEEDSLPDSHKAIKQHRKATGDALPRFQPKTDEQDE